MGEAKLERPVTTGLLLGVGLGAALTVWEALRWLVYDVWPEGRIFVAIAGVWTFLTVLVIGAVARLRQDRAGHG